METYRIEVGHRHGVKPGNIVGAIANEADLESRYIGRIDIHDDHSVLDLPEGMPRELLMHLKKVRVAGQPLRLSLLKDGAGAPQPGKPRAPAPHRKGPRPPRG
jgi:ATP-dependent RNA helicase DeaD